MPVRSMHCRMRKCQNSLDIVFFAFDAFLNKKEYRNPGVKKKYLNCILKDSDSFPMYLYRSSLMILSMGVSFFAKVDISYETTKLAYDSN